MSLSNKDNRSSRARSIPLGKRISGLVGQSDKVDFYTFNVSQVSDFSLSFNRLKSSTSVQARLLNSSGSVLAKFNVGKKPQIIEDTLPAGKYYIRVAYKGRNKKVKYQLSTIARIAEPGETPQTAYSVGNLSGTFTYRESVGEKDTLDYYKFSLDYFSDFSAGFSGVSGSALMYLYRDANNDGLVDGGEQLNYTSGIQSSISKFLKPGTYFIGIENKSNSVQYDLALTTTSYPKYTSNIDDDRALSSRNIALSQPFSTKDYVGEFDNLDFYKFTLNSVSDFNANISGVPGGALMYLYRDANSNGLADSNERLDYIVSDQDGNNISKLLIPSTYFISVERTSGFERYDLALSTTPYPDYTPAVDPGEQTLSARDLGIFSETFATKNYVGDLDEKDYYKFSLNQTKNFNASFSAVSGRVNIYLYQDSNNNQLIDSGEQIGYVPGYQAGNISQNLAPGVYFVLVEKAYGSTRYDLTLQAT